MYASLIKKFTNWQIFVDILRWRPQSRIFLKNKSKFRICKYYVIDSKTIEFWNQKFYLTRTVRSKVTQWLRNSDVRLLQPNQRRNQFSHFICISCAWWSRENRKSVAACVFICHDMCHIMWLTLTISVIFHVIANITVWTFHCNGSCCAI